MQPVNLLTFSQDPIMNNIKPVDTVTIYILRRSEKLFSTLCLILP
jgi:hypothetical protein